MKIKYFFSVLIIISFISAHSKEKYFRPIFVIKNSNKLGFSAVSFSPDGKLLAVGTGYEKVVKIFNTSDGKVIQELKGHNDSINTVAWSTDGTKIASGSIDNTIIVWNAKTYKKLKILKSDGWSNSVAWSPDNTKLASGSESNTITIWDAKTFNELYKLKEDTNQINSVAWASDSSKLASGSSDHIKIWDMKTGKNINTIHNGYAVFAVAWSPDNTKIASGTAGLRNKRAAIWDAINGQLLKIINDKNIMLSVIWSLDNTKIIGALDNQIQIWDAKTYNPLYYLSTGAHESLSSISLSKDNSKLASATNEQLIIWGY